LSATGCGDPVELMHAFHERREPGAWALLAGEVLAAAPELAIAAGHGRGGPLTPLARRPRLCPGDLLLGGGFLLHEAWVERSLREELATRMPGLAVVRLTEPPVAGAVRLALSLSSQRET